MLYYEEPLNENDKMMMMEDQEQDENEEEEQRKDFNQVTDPIHILDIKNLESPFKQRGFQSPIKNKNKNSNS